MMTPDLDAEALRQFACSLILGQAAQVGIERNKVAAASAASEVSPTARANVDFE
jgi:hypothetical protein